MDKHLVGLVNDFDQESGGMDFSTALKLLKDGENVTRASWNDIKQVALQKGYPKGIPCNKQTATCWGLHEREKFICNPYLQCERADGSFSMWVPTVDDILADDWYIYMTEEELKANGIE